MTEYHKHGVNLSDGQKTKIQNSHKNECSVSIRLSKKDLHGNDMLALTQTQINQIRKAENGVQLNLSHAQIKYMEKHGGFLPFLIPLIAGIVGAAGGLTGGIASAVSASKSNAEQVRHNREMELQNKAALEQMKSGTGVVSDAIGKVPVIGNYLKPLLEKIGLGANDIHNLAKGKCLCKNGFLCKQIGNGLYLEPEGSGLFLGPRRE